MLQYSFMYSVASSMRSYALGLHLAKWDWMGGVSPWVLGVHLFEWDCVYFTLKNLSVWHRIACSCSSKFRMFGYGPFLHLLLAEPYSWSYQPRFFPKVDFVLACWETGTWILVWARSGKWDTALSEEREMQRQHGLLMSCFKYFGFWNFLPALNSSCRFFRIF